MQSVNKSHVNYAFGTDVFVVLGAPSYSYLAKRLRVTASWGNKCPYNTVGQWVLMDLPHTMERDIGRSGVSRRRAWIT